MEAARYIAKCKTSSSLTALQKVQKALEPVKFPTFSQDKINEMHKRFFETPHALEYMRGRGFEDDTLRHFEIGYTPDRWVNGKFLTEKVAVPMHDMKGNPVGVVGRSIKDKEFKNSYRLPTSHTFFNLHRARAAGQYAIICEASFDAMRITQAGYPNVVALLGGFFSDYHLDQLHRNFAGIIIMTDFDNFRDHFTDPCPKCNKLGLAFCAGHNPGRDLGQRIASKFSKSISWASYGFKEVYPHGAKDAGDLTDEEIRQCLRNAVPNLEYQSWGLY